MQEETGNPTAFRQYLDSLQASVEQLDMKYNTGNPVTDVIMQRYVQLAKNYDIAFQADFLFPSSMNMDAFDLSIIINNALNNALEACRRQKEGRKFIELSAYRRQNMFFIIVKNSFDGKLVRAGAMADCSRQNRIPKIMDWGFGILKCVRKNIMEKRKLPFGRMSLNWRLCFRNE